LHAPDPSGLCRQLDNGERQRLGRVLWIFGGGLV
jgi:hypothetical protein